MIFISHNYMDKGFVGPIAQSLKELYGKENVFFDSWSIRPGENIIEEMNTGLKKSEVFFFFITENSLKSDMVKLEWTSVLKEKAQKGIKFIPVRCENIDVPMIISSLNYLDMYADGIDTVFTQMKEIIEDNYNEIKFPAFNNVQAYALEKDKDTVSLFIVAKRFFEPSSMFLVATNLNEKEVEVSIEGASIFNKAFNPDSGTFRGKRVNTITIGTQHGIKKGFKTEIVVNRIKGKIEILDLHHIKGENDFPKIPIKIIKDVSEINY